MFLIDKVDLSPVCFDYLLLVLVIKFELDIGGADHPDH